MASQFTSCCVRVSRSFKHSYFVLRRIFSVSGTLDSELTVDVKKDIEKHWKSKINTTDTSEAERQKFYLLSMFPYPSGYLHMGHVRIYTISDAIARFLRMRGKKVIHPIGWDAFGLPAENAAIDRNVHPAKWTAKNIEAMRKQLQMLNISFDWDKELSTCDPSYYKWTQYLFLLLFEKGLAYKKQALVNWDPVDQTVLADEQVDENGCSWRSGCKVEKRVLNQWFLRTTAFAKDLSDGLKNPELVEWRDVTKIQQHWIGECTGYTLHLKLFYRGSELDDTLPVWTDKPELIYGAAFVSVSPENLLNTVEFGGGIKSGTQQLDIEVIHPLTGSLLPVFVSDEFKHAEATNSFLGIPDINDETTFGFSLRHELQIVPVLDPTSKVLMNSEEFSRMPVTEAKEKIIDKIKRNGIKAYQTSSKLRDWLISRQRYWGTPIPIINCPTCKTVPVPLEDLPIILPHVEDFTGKSCTLKSAEEWSEVKCPRCGGSATRETDTMDTFVDSSWYFLRYLDVSNSSEIFNSQKIKAYMPVDLYIGGKEHATLHLFYARFMSHFCHSLGLLEKSEPFIQLLMHGMVHGQSYRLKDSGKYIPKDEVDFSVEPPVEKCSGLPIIIEWEKMSKSKFNGVDPEQVISEHGIDTTRLFILVSVAPESPRKWNEDLFTGIWKWQWRVWLTLSDFLAQRRGEGKFQKLSEDEVKHFEDALYSAKNYYVNGATHNYLTTRQLSVVISKLQGLTGDLRRVPKCLAKDNKMYEEALAALLIMLAPLAPHFASELWSAFCSCASGSENYDLNKPVLQQKWPTVDEEFNIDLTVKLNGKELDTVPVAKKYLRTLDKESALKLASANEKLKEQLEHIKVKFVKYKILPDYGAELNFIHIPVSKKKTLNQMKENKNYSM